MAASLFKWLSFFLVLPASTSFRPPSNLHPLYISVTEINYNAKDKTLELACKIFTNDFEKALEKSFNTHVDLSLPSSKPAAEKEISNYIPKHLKLVADGKPAELQFVGSEKETDATWCYFQANNVSPVKKLEVDNSILYELFDSEINIMHVSVNGNRKSIKISNPETKAVFEF